VTGGQTSNIYGTIQTAGFGSAALWLINPAGIVFGPSASLNVGGSVHFSTADYLRLGSGNDRFYADLGKTSQLTSAAVTAFGFLGEHPAGPVTVQAGSPLAVSEGKVIDLIGGDISVTGRTLSAPGGQISLASVSGAGEVVPNQAGQTPSLDLVNVSKQGTIQLTEGAILRTSSAMSDAGAILIRSGEFITENAGIEAKTSAPLQIGTTSGSDTEFPTDFVACCKGGTVDIAANSISLKGGVFETTRPQSGQKVSGITIWTNNQGDITLGTKSLTLDNAKIFTDAQTLVAFPFPETGFIHIQGLEGEASRADHVSIRNNSLLDTEGYSDDKIGGRVGRDINVNAHNMDLSNSRLLSVDGSIILDVTQTILSGGNNLIQTTANGGHNGGHIMLTADEAIVMARGDRVESILGSIGPSPFVRLGSLSLTAPRIILQGTRIESVGTAGSGHSGSGEINLRGKNIEIADASTINGFALSGFPPGNVSGNISISGWDDGTSAEVIRILGGSSLASGGPKGEKTFGTPGHITLDGQLVIFDGSKATVSQSGAGGSGDITIRAGELNVVNGSIIEATSSGSAFSGPAGATLPANAGNINFTSSGAILIANSTVSTSAAQGSGGDIDLTAPNIVRLVGANLTSSVAGPPGSNGGNITVDTAHPQFVIIQDNSQILARANAGQGGAITIIGGVVLQEPGSVLDATAGPAGISGSINIQSPIQQLSGAIAPLPQAFAVATNLYGQRCAAEKGGQFSSFVQGARDGVPPQPGDLIPSPLMLELNEVPLSSSLQSTSSLSAIRLGLPEFEQTSRSSLTVFAACRS
jgi:large exoprotein involved in heme utilization and adhesion